MPKNELELVIEEIQNKITPGNRLIQVGNFVNKASKGQDIDTYEYHEIDGENNIIHKYLIQDSQSIYPPFNRKVTYEKFN